MKNSVFKSENYQKNENYHFYVTISVNMVQLYSTNTLLFYPKSVLPSSCPVYPLSATLDKVLCLVSRFPRPSPACFVSVPLGTGLCVCLLETNSLWRDITKIYWHNRGRKALLNMWLQLLKGESAWPSSEAPICTQRQRALRNKQQLFVYSHRFSHTTYTCKTLFPFQRSTSHLKMSCSSYSYAFMKRSFQTSFFF